MTPHPDAFQHFEISRRDDGEAWVLRHDASSVTYKALDTRLLQSVALTLFDATVTETDSSREAVLQRAKAIAIVRDDRVATVLNFGVDESQLFLVRQFVDGESIKQAIERQGAFRWQDALKIALLVARGLSAAAERGVKHGNVAPDTVILTTPNRAGSKRDIVLVDFALSSNETIDARADVRSVGVLLRSMLVGNLATPSHIVASHTFGQIHLSDLPAGVHHVVPQLLQQLLTLDERHQPSTATELVARIQLAIDIASGATAHAGFPDPNVINLSADVPGELIDDRGSEEAAPVIDENLQFTAYRPKTVRPGVWTKMLVFAHLDERPDWMDQDERAPFEEVQAQAKQLLGDKIESYKHSTDDSRVGVPRDGEITILPEVDGVEFNPPRRSFFWRDAIAVHAESFDMRAGEQMDGQIARGRLTIFLGRIILAEITLAIRVERGYIAPTVVGSFANGAELQERSHSRSFRKVFASYSHRDLGIVEEMEQHARAFGDEYLRDWVHLRSGERWNAGLKELISAADVFQLFWSPNSARSEFVADEWRYALALGRNAFVRPTYWQDPMPDPPEALKPLHFHRLAISVVKAPEVTVPQIAVPWNSDFDDATNEHVTPISNPVAPTISVTSALPDYDVRPQYNTPTAPPELMQARGSNSRMLIIAVVVIVAIVVFFAMLR